MRQDILALRSRKRDTRSVSRAPAASPGAALPSESMAGAGQTRYGEAARRRRGPPFTRLIVFDTFVQ